MSDQRNAIFIGAIGGIISGVIVEIIKITLLDSSSSTLGLVTSIAALMVAVIVGVAMARYWIIFTEYNGKAEGSRERETADGLRERLEQGGGAGEIYEKALTRCLNAVDRFFGDADPAVKTLWPRAFGYRGQAPFWTAPAYDCCITIALVYPLLAMLITWTVTGVVGPGEKAIGLGGGVEDLWRWMRLTCFILAVITVYFTIISIRKRSKIVLFALSIVFASGVLNIAFFLIIAACGLYFGFKIADNSFGPTRGALIVSFSGGIIAVDADAIFVAIVCAVALEAASYIARKRQITGLFLILFTLIFLMFCYASAYWRSGTDGWERADAPLLFLGVLTLVNAPFDWLTIGLTRALLRRGLELRKGWPLVLAFVDLVLAAAIIVLLAIAMLLAVQAFEYVGGTPILGVEKVLNDLADPEMRTHPEYWWLYATLFSTLIPSIINVAIGALSIMRGSNWFHRRVASAMPAGQAMLVVDAIWIVPLLALEVLGSVVIGVALTLGWIWVVVAKLFPLFGGLIPMLRAVAGLG